MNEKIKQELNRCLNCKNTPCKNACPLGNDIPTIIQLMKQEKYKEAYEALTKTTVLPSICGKICPHTKQCQGKCTLGIKGNSIQIGEIEEYLTELAIKEKYDMKKSPQYENNKIRNKKVAVIGAGPAGLTCATFLARSGFKVTIYEKHNDLGGILSHGIPEFRLSKDELDNAISNILSLEINIKYNCELGKDINIDELVKKYDAVFLSLGANISSKMNIEGEDLNGVYGANELLEYKKEIDFVNKNVAIIGGGNVAIDVARTIKRRGVKSVTIIYRRSEEQMPAEDKEVGEAKRDGIRYLFQNNITKIIGDINNNVKNIECIKTELIQKEGEKRLVPINIKNSNYTLDMDIVIMAVGSKTDEKLLNNLDLKLNKYRYIEVNEKHQTSKEKVFAGGDLVGEKATVAWAAKSGREAAEDIEEYLDNIL